MYIMQNHFAEIIAKILQNLSNLNNASSNYSAQQILFKQVLSTR